MINNILKPFCAENANIGDERGFFCIFFGHNDRFHAKIFQTRNNRQNSVHSPQRTIQRELPDERSVFQKPSVQNSVLCKDSHRHGQVVICSLFFQIRRSKVYDHFFVGKKESCVFNSRTNPFFCLIYGSIGKSDNGNARN